MKKIHNYNFWISSYITTYYDFTILDWSLFFLVRRLRMKNSNISEVVCALPSYYHISSTTLLHGANMCTGMYQSP